MKRKTKLIFGVLFAFMSLLPLFCYLIMDYQICKPNIPAMLPYILSGGVGGILLRGYSDG